MAGITGKYSLAEQVQKVVHSVIGSKEPQGWDNQLDAEPVLNLYFSKKRKIWNTSKFDGAASVDLAAGNFVTSISAGLETRIGLKPDGFAYIYDPMGLSLPYDASLPQSSRRSEFYVSLVARARAWALFMPLDGNILVSGNEWTDNNTIDPERYVGQGIVGIHYVRPSWGAHINWTFNTDTVDTSQSRRMKSFRATTVLQPSSGDSNRTSRQAPAIASWCYPLCPKDFASIQPRFEALRPGYARRIRTTFITSIFRPATCSGCG